MAHKIYDNFLLSSLISDQYDSHLDLMQFATVNNDLVGTPGMLWKVHVYKATNGTEKLEMGEGNSKSIEVSYDEKEYRIQLAQNKFEYYDEQEMTDDMLIPTGTRHMGTDMFNTVNGDIYGELGKATMVVLANNFDFDAFVDGQAMFELENLEDVVINALVSPLDVAEIRKKLKDSLQYVEKFARAGYVGTTVAGVNIYTKKNAVKGEIRIFTKEAVTAFNKRGVEVEQERDADIRKNSIFSRKYYVVALTDETKAVRILKGTAAVSEDTEVDADKTYYELAGTGYVAVDPEDGDNPSTKGWYEITAA